MRPIDHTHDANARSWLESANAPAVDFPIQNLPFAIFRAGRAGEAFRGGVAIGDQIVDLAALANTALLDGPASQGAKAASAPALNALLECGPRVWQALRHALFALLRAEAAAEAKLALQGCMVPQAAAEFSLPASIGDYTDFYTSLPHALNSVRMADPQADVSSNFRHMPIGYHGRASTVEVSGHRFHRPWGQNKMPWEPPPAMYRPARWLDYELEIAAWVGPGNAPGCPVALSDAEDHLFGIGLLNDWSARDTQIWEMAPLGPFLSKSFATTVSPWIVTFEALAPYRRAWIRDPAEPPPLPYLDHADHRAAGAIDLVVEAWLETPHARRAGLGPERLSRTNFNHQYWTLAQMLTHHASGGCALHSGDLLGSGTISGPLPQEAGSMLELTQAGRQPLRLATGESRAFLEDGDTVILRGWCEAPGRARIGFGECRGEVLPALQPEVVCRTGEFDHV